jgi:putative membrane protein
LLLPVAGQGLLHQAIFIVVASFMVVLTDVVIDPMIIHKTGRNWWIWEKRGRFYGVPLGNFVGWFMTAILIYILLFALVGDLFAVPNVSLWIEYLPAFDYCLIMAAFAWACLARSLIGPGIIGLFVAMSCLALGLANIIH